MSKSKLVEYPKLGVFELRQADVEIGQYICRFCCFNETAGLCNTSRKCGSDGYFVPHDDVAKATIVKEKLRK